MKQTIFTLLIAGYSLWPACQHPDIIMPIEPNPVDSSNTATCEDTIEINFPGAMEHGFFKAVKTCRDFKASGYAHWPGDTFTHLNISARTYFPYILTNGDTAFLNAEGFAFFVPRKIGKFPMISVPGVHTDTVTCWFSYLDVDITISDWFVDSSFSDNVLEITELDMVNNRVKGRFNVHLKIDTSRPDYDDRYPFTLYFYDGEFDLEIIE